MTAPTTTRQLLLHAWEFNPLVIALCLLALAGYLRFHCRLSIRAFSFAAAIALFFVALSSPIAVLARGDLFSAHMLQHLLLLLLIPPLFLIGLPPKPVPRQPTREDRSAIRYGAPWLAGASAMWLWHEPVLCNAAATIAWVQWLQTGSLCAAGLWFWRPIFGPRIGDRFHPLAAILYLFAACASCTVLGILVTFSPVELCSAYLRPLDPAGALPLVRRVWGLSCAADQKLGGLMMWVPACFIYAGAILAVLARYYNEERPRPVPLQLVRGAGLK